MISLRSVRQSTIVLVRPGATSFDQQGRMKGSLDMPLCEQGREQAIALSEELASLKLDAVYCAPCQSASETAASLVEGRDLKPRVIDAFRNIDHGLWHGKLIDEIRRNQPRLYRTGTENPESVCPPGGETVVEAAARVRKVVERLIRRSRNQVIALVIPDPLATVIASQLRHESMPEIWKAETDAGNWQLIEASV